MTQAGPMSKRNTKGKQKASTQRRYALMVLMKVKKTGEVYLQKTVRKL